jgi:hypothetical protein
MLLQPTFLPGISLLVNNSKIPVKFNLRGVSEDSTEFYWLEWSAEIPVEILEVNRKSKITFSMQSPEDPALLPIFEQPLPNTSILTNYERGKFALKSISIQPIDLQ